jgi:hypothetical protein
MMLPVRSLVLLLLIASACAEPARVDGGGPSVTDRAGKEIVTIRFREGLVEVHTGPEGLRYTALDAEGNVLAAGLTASELLASYPDHFSACETGIAGSPDAPLDASLQVPLEDVGRPGSQRLRPTEAGEH